jgi:hypothetical protein
VESLYVKHIIKKIEERNSVGISGFGGLRHIIIIEKKPSSLSHKTSIPFRAGSIKETEIKPNGQSGWGMGEGLLDWFKKKVKICRHGSKGGSVKGNLD